jgi:hypothetical protein
MAEDTMQLLKVLQQPDVDVQFLYRYLTCLLFFAVMFSFCFGILLACYFLPNYNQSQAFASNASVCTKCGTNAADIVVDDCQSPYRFG